MRMRGRLWQGEGLEEGTPTHACTHVGVEEGQAATLDMQSR